MQTTSQATTPSITAPADEKYLVFSGDFWLGPTMFTDQEQAQLLADKNPGHIVRPLSDVLAENEARAVVLV